MPSRNLEIKIHEATGLKDVNPYSEMDVYVFVSLPKHPVHQTPVVKNGGRNPEWRNCLLSFSIDEEKAMKTSLALHFRIRAKMVFGDKDLGDVYVPIRELLEAYTGDFVAYSVRRPSGRLKGLLYLSFKFVGKESMSTEFEEYQKRNFIDMFRTVKGLDQPPIEKDEGESTKGKNMEELTKIKDMKDAILLFHVAEVYASAPMQLPMFTGYKINSPRSQKGYKRHKSCKRPYSFYLPPPAGFADTPVKAGYVFQPSDTVGFSPYGASSLPQMKKDKTGMGVGVLSGLLRGNLASHAREMAAYEVGSENALVN